MALAAKSDAKEIFELQRIAFFSEAELYNDFNIPPLRQTLSELELEFSSSIFFKYCEQERIVGSARGRLVGETCQVNRLIVHPDFRRQGIATELMRELESEFSGKCVRFEIFTGSKSLGNIALYQKLGYSIFDLRELGTGLSFVYLEKRPA